MSRDVIDAAHWLFLDEDLDAARNLKVCQSRGHSWVFSVDKKWIIQSPPNSLQPMCTCDNASHQSLMWNDKTLKDDICSSIDFICLVLMSSELHKETHKWLQSFSIFFTFKTFLMRPNHFPCQLQFINGNTPFVGKSDLFINLNPPFPSPHCIKKEPTTKPSQKLGWPQGFMAAISFWLDGGWEERKICCLG